MMCYVLKTSHDRVIVIDGGTRGDALNLREFLAALGNRIHTWFITHPHSDHVAALSAILEDPGAMRIDGIYGVLPEDAWIVKHEPERLEDTRSFRAALERSSRSCEPLQVGQVLAIDGVRIEVLSANNPGITRNAVNNSSMVIRVSDARKSVLFTGDLGVEGGEKLLAGPFGESLHADYVQMAHHGQSGCDESFYRAVKPDYCLWPTPRWLWDNDSGGGKGSGPWKTLEVRGWMENLGVLRNCVSANGCCRVD
jgi:beta-lactamase superfamily II metal-dependent hydrolase